MKTHHSTIGIALVLLLAGAGNSHAGKTQDLRWRCTGSSTFADGVETHIDTDGVGASAGLNQGLQNCTIGRFFFQEEAEYAGPFAVTTCPQGSAEYHLVQHHGVNIEEKTSDQLFEAADAITLCLNSDLTFSATGHISFTSGTGHFTGASGAFDFQATGKYLAFGFRDNIFGGFGQSSFTSTGTLTLPHGE